MSQTAAAVAPEPKRILVVDDEFDNRELLEIILEREGYVMSMASSGDEALATIALDPPDLVLLDIMMPGMDGYQVVARIKSNPLSQHIPVLMVTALDAQTVRELARSAGAEDVLTKPVDRADLCARVRKLLRLSIGG